MSVALANKIVHMTAHNEVRKNFLLTDVRNSMAVHSDVGEGYATKTVEETVEITINGKTTILVEDLFPLIFYQKKVIKQEQE